MTTLEQTNKTKTIILICVLGVILVSGTVGYLVPTSRDYINNFIKMLLGIVGSFIPV